MLTSSNYSEAVSVLEKKFRHKQEIVSRHMEVLLNVNSVDSTHDLLGLRRLHDAAELHVGGLNSLGVSFEKCRSFLSSVLLGILP